MINQSTPIYTYTGIWQDEDELIRFSRFQFQNPGYDHLDGNITSEPFKTRLNVHLRKVSDFKTYGGD